MKIFVLTLFPDLINNALSHSIIGRAINNGLITVECINFRDFSKDKHKHVDDYPYGGGVGMVIQPQPIYDAYEHILKRSESSHKPRVIYMTPVGKTFAQHTAKELSKEESLIILCGHYEGIDERIIEEIVTDEISIGDYILTGGELAACVVIDAVGRLIPSVLSKEQATLDESFSNGLLEYPQYTRPSVFMGKSVPDILLSGNHAKIEQWRREQAIIRTKDRRPDLFI